MFQRGQPLYFRRGRGTRGNGVLEGRRGRGERAGLVAAAAGDVREGSSLGKGGIFGRG